MSKGCLPHKLQIRGYDGRAFKNLNYKRAYITTTITLNDNNKFTEYV